MLNLSESACTFHPQHRSVLCSSETTNKQTNNRKEELGDEERLDRPVGIILTACCWFSEQLRNRISFSISLYLWDQTSEPEPSVFSSLNKNFTKKRTIQRLTRVLEAPHAASRALSDLIWSRTKGRFEWNPACEIWLKRSAGVWSKDKTLIQTPHQGENLIQFI